MPLPAHAALEPACFNGELTTAGQVFIPAADEGFLRGDGVFEYLICYAGRPFAVEQHLERLEHSAKGLMLEIPPRHLLLAEVERVMQRRAEADVAGAPDGHGDNSALRIVCTRGGNRLVVSEPLPTRLDSVRLAFVTYQPTVLLSGLKTLSYGANMLATRVAVSRGFDEALLVTPEGTVLEAPTSSIFWVDREGTLCTPPVGKGILASITRQIVADTNVVTERQATREDMLTASEAFLTSTTREVQPVSAIEGHQLPTDGPVTTAAAQRFTAFVNEWVAGSSLKDAD